MVLTIEKFVTQIDTFVSDDSSTILAGKQTVMDSIVVSPDSRRIACVIKEIPLSLRLPLLPGAGYSIIPHPSLDSPSSSKYFIAINGNEQGENKYDGIVKNSFCFSPNSQRWAYAASENNQQFVIVDGVKGEPHGLVLAREPRLSSIQTDIPIFSHDSQHVAYVAVDNPLGSYACVVLDGERLELQFQDITFLEFSPESHMLAYIYVVSGVASLAVADVNTHQSVPVLNKNSYDGISSFSISPDDREIAFTAMKRGKRFVVKTKEDSEGNPYDGINLYCPIFSPNSQRLAYTAVKGNKELVISDKIEGKMYDGCNNPIFSLNSQHIAYIATSGNKQLAVIDNGSVKSFMKGSVKSFMKERD